MFDLYSSQLFSQYYIQFLIKAAHVRLRTDTRTWFSNSYQICVLSYIKYPKYFHLNFQELRQRRRIDDIMREIYQIKHVDLLEPPMCSSPAYVYPGSRDNHPRFMYDSDPYDSMVVNAAQYNDSVRRFLGYTKRSDRLKAMEHSRKYKAYLDLRKKLKHLY